jgi:uncharacterized membrane protein YvbJ
MEEDKKIFICPKCGTVGASEESSASCYKCGHPEMIRTAYSKKEWSSISEDQKKDAINAAMAHSNDDMLKILADSREQLISIRKWVMFLGIVVIVQLVATAIVVLSTIL